MEQFIAELVKQGGGYVLAGLALLLLNAVWQQRLADEKERSKEKDADRQTLLTTLDANTKVKQELITTLRTMQDESRASRLEMEAKTTEITNAISGVATSFASHAALMEQGRSVKR